MSTPASDSADVATASRDTASRDTTSRDTTSGGTTSGGTTTDLDPAGPATSDAPPARPDSGRAFWKELPFLVVIALVLALLIKTFLLQAFYIPSASMENTLQGGPPGGGASSSGHPYDRVLVNKLVYDFRSPHRGEIVVFTKPPGWPSESTYSAPSNPVLRFFHAVGSAIGVAPSGDSDFIKRVIGVGGDTISCNQDVLSVNGHRLTEPYLYPGSHQCSGLGFDGQTKHVPPGSLFVMGDHRDDSADSRQYGYVPVSDVIGRAFVVIWPVSDWKTLPIPATFKQAGLAAAGSPAFPAVAGLVLVSPVAMRRERRRRQRRRAAYAARDV